MALPTVVVTPGTGQTINTLAAGGQAAAASSHPFVAASEHAVAAGATATLPLSVQGVASGVLIGVSVSGTVTVGSHAVTNAGTFAVQVTSAPTTAVTGTFWQATQPVSIATAPALVASTATIGGVVLKPSAVAPGQTATRVVAAASTNATSAKASAGNVVNIDLFNVAAYTVFLKFYDKASAPTVGTDTPIMTIPIPTLTGFSREFLFGKPFATGIAWAITKLQADSDTTVLVAGDVTGAISWI